MMRTQSREDYISTMYLLAQDSDEGISLTDIARKLKVSKASVSEMIRKLSEERYVSFKRYSKIHLTPDGIKEGQRIVHNHRVIEYFLKIVLKCNVKDIHDEAHKLEHAFSQSTIRKLDNFLGNPKVAPSGLKIPH